MTTDAAGGATFGRILGIRGDLERPGLSARQGCGRAARGDHEVGAQGIDSAEEHDACAGRELDAGHAAGSATLWAHRRGREVKQLGVGGDEHEVLITGAQFDSADHRVVVLETDDLPVAFVAGVVDSHAFDDALGGSDGEAGGVLRQ